MKFQLLLAAALLAPAGGSPPVLPADETLRYTVNWPSGLSLGEGTLTARKAGGEWDFSLELEAAIPGFQVVDRFLSRASAGFCSIHFEKNSVHGKRKAREKTVFDGQLATRTTLEGGDALAFLYFLRQEITQGRVPPPQTVYFGAPYQVRLDYKGAQPVESGSAVEKGDRLVASVKGPSSNFSFEILLGRDPARTPLLIKVPLELGTFSMELVR